MKIKRKEKVTLDKAQPLGAVKARAIVGTYQERLAEGTKRIKDLEAHLEAGGYGTVPRKTLVRLALDLGIVVRHYGKYKGLVAPRLEQSKTMLLKEVKQLNDTEQALLLKVMSTIKEQRAR